MSETITATVPELKHRTREAWLEAAVELCRPIFKGKNYDIPPVKISTGWPSSRGLSKSKQAVGQCWDSASSEDNKTHQIFISPVLVEDNTPNGVLSTLVHEIVHAVVGCKQGHGKAFKKCALAVGLEGKMTECGANADLLARFKQWEEDLGPYPHQKLNPALSGVKKQGTRMIKCECSCGYVVRTTRKWIDQIGAPICPCNNKRMIADIPDEDDSGDEGGGDE